MQKKEKTQNQENNQKLTQNSLWDDWTLFKKNEYTNPQLQLKKQGATFKNDQYGEFTYRPSSNSPPSMQEFYESVINGIIRRYQMGLYQGEYQYYLELQTCLHEFIRMLNFKSEILVEVFQTITNINLSKESQPNIVVPCNSCHMYIFVNYHCKNCYSAFYCDKTCQKNHQLKHEETQCKKLTKLTPSISYPLQVEIHCGGDLGENLEIYYQHEKRLSLKYSGDNFINSIYKILLKNRWLKNNHYQIGDQKQSNCIKLQFKQEQAQKQQQLEQVHSSNQQQEYLAQNEDELFLKMPVIQEIRVIFLNQGAILQDVVKETYDLYSHYVHIYYFPI